MKERRFRLPKKFIVVIIIFVAFCSILLYTGGLLKDLDYFKIKQIIFNGSSLIQLSHLKGRNIFSIDLAQESAYIAKLYPSYKKVKLIRILPASLFVDFIKRTPLAYVRLYRNFCVDDDLVLFDTPRQIQEPDLPLILGLDTKIFGVSSGKKCNITELALAIDIIKEARANPVLRANKIRKIDVANANNVSFFLSDGLEVKIGRDSLKKKINILTSLLSRSNSDNSNIKYIDLRFKEPVIRLKDAK